MKYCSKCGNQVVNEAVICPKCGCPIAELQTQKTNGWAIAGFILSFFEPLLGFIFGGIGISRSDKVGGKGYALSIAALIISVISFALWLVFYINLFSGLIEIFI